MSHSDFKGKVIRCAIRTRSWNGLFYRIAFYFNLKHWRWLDHKHEIWNIESTDIWVIHRWEISANFGSRRSIRIWCIICRNNACLRTLWQVDWQIRWKQVYYENTWTLPTSIVADSRNWVCGVIRNFLTIINQSQRLWIVSRIFTIS